jgi:aminopeptidase
MRDPRLEQYGRIILDTCLGVQPGWEVMVTGGVLARPLLEVIMGQLAQRGAYALLRVRFDGNAISPYAWAREAPLDLLEHPSPIELEVMQRIDALVVVQAPENTMAQAGVPPERATALMTGMQPVVQRQIDHVFPWVGGQYPTDALAQEAGMPTDEFADFLYAAVLRDWDAERERMRRYADLFDAAEEVRLLGEGTDLRLSIAGREMIVDAGGRNLPGGEFFTSPVEASAEGVVTFAEFPAIYQGQRCAGVRLRFEAGRVVDASAETGEDFLIATLDTDEGARRLGELGVGCNPAITRHMRNTLFDEKMDGTVHLALGGGFKFVGGTNESAVHWDMVKDLRPGGRIELDGRVVQQDGVWQLAA